MKFTIQIKWEDDSSTPITVAEIERTGPLKAGTLGLTLAESKGLMAKIQKEFVESQVHLFIQDQRFCTQCGSLRTIKDYHTACFKSLFGGIGLRIPRLNGCTCGGKDAPAKTVKVDSLVNWLSPEFEFIQGQLAATIPYARTAELLGLLLPVGAGNAPSTVRRPAIRVGQRLDAELLEQGAILRIPIPK